MPPIARPSNSDDDAAEPHDLLPAAHIMFTAAHMQGILKELGTVTPETEERAFNAALTGEPPAVAHRSDVTDDMAKEFFKARRPPPQKLP